MKNLEEQIINRLNKVLNKYNLVIISKINHNYKTTISVDDIFKNYCYRYVLVEIFDNTIIECYLTWKYIEFMLLNSDFDYSIFGSINIAHNKLKKYNNFSIQQQKRYIVLDKLYNELCPLNDCFCLEELIIKMDLIGI